VTLGLPALVALWPHCQVGQGHRAGGDAAAAASVWPWENHPVPSFLSSLSEKQGQHRFAASPGCGESSPSPWWWRPRKEEAAGVRGSAPRSRCFVRAQSRVSGLPTACRSREAGWVPVFTELPGS